MPLHVAEVASTDGDDVCARNEGQKSHHGRGMFHWPKWWHARSPPGERTVPDAEPPVRRTKRHLRDTLGLGPITFRQQLCELSNASLRRPPIRHRFVPPRLLAGRVRDDLDFPSAALDEPPVEVREPAQEPLAASSRRVEVHRRLSVNGDTYGMTGNNELPSARDRHNLTQRHAKSMTRGKPRALAIGTRDRRDR